MEYLREHGPSPGHELPQQIRTADKTAGVTKFTLKTPGVSGNSTYVYYLFGEHSKASVVRAWLDAHERVAERTDIQEFSKFLSAQGSSWVTAAKADGVFEEYRDRFGSGRSVGSASE